MAFGTFDSICKEVGFPICSVIGRANATLSFERGVLPLCYARPVEIANTMIFQMANAFVHFGAIVVFLIIIFNVKSKYTAIGRSEFYSFICLNLVLLIFSLVVDCGVSPPASSSFAYFVALQLGLTSAVCISLLYNGIVCFQYWEDGSKKSMWAHHFICFAWFAVTFVVAIVTFKAWTHDLDNRKTTAIFVVAYVMNAVILVMYVISQLILVFFALDSKWHLGAIALFTFFFVAGQLLTYLIGKKVCEGTQHYLDGLVVGSLGNLFAVMMVYKFWDMITAEDLEFSVANVEQGVPTFQQMEKRNSGYFY